MRRLHGVSEYEKKTVHSGKKSMESERMKLIMRKSGFFGISMLAACVSVVCGEEKWIPLFNGKDLEGWTPKIADFPLGENPGRVFRVEDGLLKVSYVDSGDFKGQFGHLFYKTPYSHYRIRGEFRFTGDQQKGGPGWAFRNNGFMLHSQAPETMTVEQKFPNSIEVQFSGADAEKSPQTALRPMGCLFTPGTIVTIDGKDNEGGDKSATGEPMGATDWVTVEAEVRGGEEIIHRVNGKEVLRYQNTRLESGAPLTSGYIAIQAETHPIEFRSIELLVSAENQSAEKSK